MIQRKDKKFTWNRFYKAMLVILVLIFGGFVSFALNLLSNLRNEFDYFFDGFDVESSLIDENYINFTFLEQRALEFEELIGMYHIPFNMTGEGWDYYPPVSVCFNWANSSWKYYNNTQLLAAFDPLDESDPHNNKSIMTYCGDKGHTALYEGVYCAGEAFRYAWAKRNNDIGNMSAAEDRILKIMKSYDLLSNVSDKSVFVRYAVPNTELAYQKFPGHWDPIPTPGEEYTPNNDHYIAEYRGYNWSLSRHLSRDVSIGIMMGLAMSYFLVDNASIRAIAGRVIDKSVEYWYNSNWRIIDTDGVTHTSGDFSSSRPMLEGGTILTFLQMGKMVNPTKWGPIYYHYVYDLGLITTIGRSMRIGVDLSPKIFDGYYGCNFVFNCAPSLILLEEDPVLREIYLRNWLNVIHDFTKLHRNANFDVVWLLCHSDMSPSNLYTTPTVTLKNYDLDIWKKANIKDPDNLTYIEAFTIRDIKDCLVRYAIRRYPNRDYYWATKPGTFPNVHQQKIKGGVDEGIKGTYEVPYPDYDYWEYTTESGDLINSILALFGRTPGEEQILNASLPVDMRKTEDIMWQRNPFTVGTTERLTTTPGRFQAPMGPEYLSVYWIAKYLGIL